jgi:endonuclease/exonuclease/phosphatase family metal-dependent hydrolase
VHMVVMTYNIRIGTFNPLGLEGVARLIERHRPDVVGLQEVNVQRHRTGPVDQPGWLAARLGCQSAFGPSEAFEEKQLPAQVGYYGNALLTRFPVLVSEVQRLPKAKPSDEQRTIIGVALATEQGPLNAFVTHWGLDPVQRAAQAEATAAFVRTWRPGPPAILMGDFNAAPDSTEIATVRGALSDAWELAGVPIGQRSSFPSGPAGSTMPGGWAGAIDYVFVSAGWSVEQIAVIHDEERASDHNPVLATLRR